MKKEKTMALVMGLVMLGSIGGFAFSYMPLSQQNPQNPNGDQQAISSVLNRELTRQEVSTILQAGGIIIENVYFSDCTTCAEGNSLLENFARQFSSFVVLSQVSIDPVSSQGSTPEERLRMLTGTGQVIDLERDDLSEEFLLDTFCSVAPVQPAECVLRQI